MEDRVVMPHELADEDDELEHAHTYATADEIIPDEWLDYLVLFPDCTADEEKAAEWRALFGGEE